MSIELSAFRWVPPFARGYVRDLRVRWALEEAGLPYEVRLIDPEIQASDSYRRWQPFGQVPAYRDGRVEMFESGAIVLHIARQSEVLAPVDEAGRVRVETWVLAALNTIEPSAQNFASLEVTYGAQAPGKEQESLDRRLEALAAWLGQREYLEQRFSAGDLMMTTVLRELVACGALAHYPTLDAYRLRCEARPAFARALEGQLQPFREHPAG